MSLTSSTAPSPHASRAGEDIGFAVGIVLVLCLFFLPVPALMIDFGLAFSIALSVLILMVGAVDSEAAGILCVPDRPAGGDGAAAGAQHFDDPADPVSRRARHDGGGLHHRRLRAAGHGRRFRHRHHRLSHSRDDQLPRHHQGRHAYRRSRRAIHARRHSGQADGDRRGPVGRPHRREGRASAQARTRRGERLLRIDGRRLEVRARRRDRQLDHPRRQYFRRHRDRRHAARAQRVERRRRISPSCRSATVSSRKFRR